MIKHKLKQNLSQYLIPVLIFAVIGDACKTDVPQDCSTVPNSECRQDPDDNNNYKCLCLAGHKGNAGEAVCEARGTTSYNSYITLL